MKKIILLGCVFFQIQLISQTQLSLDPSFGSSGNPININELAGVSVNVLSTYSQIRDIKLQNDGKIIAVGSIENSNGNEQFGFSRYNSNGSLDMSFGNNGVSIVSFNSSRDRVYCVDIQSSGKIIGAGTSELNPSVYRENAIVRLNTDGSIDSSFGINGHLIISLGNDSASAIHEIKVLPNDKILAICTGWNGISYRAHIARFNNNGSVDSTFGTNGATFTNMYITLWGLNLQSDNKIIVAGYVNDSILFGNYDQKAILQRYDVNGILDSTFGINGSVIKDFGTNDERFTKNISIFQDDKILVSGWVGEIGTLNTGVSDLLLAKYSSNGIPDSTFGSNGFVVQDEKDPFNPAKNISNRTYSGTQLLSDGSILVVGWNYYAHNINAVNYGASDVTFWKFKTNGFLDTLFSSNGYFRSNLSPNNYASQTRVDDFIVLPNNKILVAGSMNTYNDAINYPSNTLAQFIINQSTGVDDLQSTDFNVFPNPALSNITVILKQQDVLCEYEVYATSGLTVLSGKITNSENINLTSLNKGVYFLKITSNKENKFSTVKKIVKH